MNEYETVCLLQPDLPPARQEKVREKVQKILAENRAELISQKDWGKRKLAYRLGKFNFGHYLYFNYEGNGAFIAELERMLKYEEGVLRYLTVSLATERDKARGKKIKKVDTVEDFVLPVDDFKPFFRGGDRGEGRRKEFIKQPEKEKGGLDAAQEKKC